MRRPFIVLDPQTPPSVRRGHRRSVLEGGPTAVQKGSWVDPDDVKPDARKTPRRIDGWRVYCPLRRIMASGGTITEDHILAADWLRLNVDLAAIGRSRSRYDGQEAVDESKSGPRAGPSELDLRQVVASSDVGRALKPFDLAHLRLLSYVVLENYALQRWAQMETERLGRRIDPKIELGRLVAILEILAKFCEAEIEEMSQQGRLPAI